MPGGGGVAIGLQCIEAGVEKNVLRGVLFMRRDQVLLRDSHSDDQKTTPLAPGTTPPRIDAAVFNMLPVMAVSHPADEKNFSAVRSAIVFNRLADHPVVLVPIIPPLRI